MFCKSCHNLVISVQNAVEKVGELLPLLLVCLGFGGGREVQPVQGLEPLHQQFSYSLKDQSTSTSKLIHTKSELSICRVVSDLGMVAAFFAY